MCNGYNTGIFVLLFEISFSMYNSRKICLSQTKIMQTVIALGKKHVLHHENIAYHKTPFREWTLSLHYMKAVLTIARDGHLRRNLESALARLIIIHGGGGQVRRINFNKSKKKNKKWNLNNPRYTFSFGDYFFTWHTFPYKGVLNSFNGYENDISF